MTDMTRDDVVYEERTRRTRVVLAVILIILFVLLIGLTVFVVRLVTPVGTPAGSDGGDDLEWVRSIYGYGTGPNEQLLAPNDAAVGSDGTIWITDGQRARVLGFDPSGDYRSVIEQGGEGQGPGQLFRPDAIDVSEDGEVYLADYGNQKIVVLSEENEFLREWEVPAPLEVVVRDGRVAVGTFYGLAILTEEGELITTVGTRGSGEDEFDGVRGVEITEDGTILVADTHNKRVKAYSGDGDLLWISPPPEVVAQREELGSGQEPDDGFPVLQLPAGVTLDGAGRLVVVDAFGFNLVVIDPTQEGRLIATYGSEGAEDGKFIYPTGIDYDSERDWFVVADTRNNRAQVVRIPGSGGGLGAAARRAWAGPLRLCAIPLVLLVIAALILATRMRRKGEARSDENHILRG